MSIVYDYLKQIQAKKPLDKAVPVASQAVATPVSAPVPKKKAIAPLWLKITVAILGCLLLGAGLYFFPPKAEKTTVKVYQAPEKPKARASASAVQEEGLILEGIIYNPSRPFAIINGKMLEAGGRVGDFEATEITSDSVSLKNVRDGTSRTIRL